MKSDANMKNSCQLMNINASKRNVRARKTGSYGGHTSQNGPGGQYERITVRMAKPGSILRMTSRVLAPIAGMRMDWVAFVTKNSGCVSHWRSGMVAIPF